MFTIITDAYTAFEDLHGGEHPVRTRDELRAVTRDGRGAVREIAPGNT